MLYLIAFLLCVPAANWMIGNVGTVCAPDGPCLIPVGFGLMAPSGVLVVGLAFVLRDMVHRRLGAWHAVAGIVIGAAASLVVAPPALAMASAAAFLLSELADFAVYAPLARRRWWTAVIASSVVGSIIDSAAFLAIAFGSLGYLAGQLAGKLWAVCVAVLVLWLFRGREVGRL